MFAVLFAVSRRPERPDDDLTHAALLRPEAQAKRFDSITRPGHGLMLCPWHDQDAATAGLTDMPGRHCVVPMIRDYGTFARTEAPHYYPTVRTS